jgi:shikimate 5-dehydrogenase
LKYVSQPFITAEYTNQSQLAYHSRETPLAAQFRENKPRGWTLVDPVEVLYEQGCAQFELFTGCKASRKSMWEACLEKYAEQMKAQTSGPG